jgi:ComF family protein
VPVDPRESCSGCLRPLPRAATAAAPRCGACLTEPIALERLIAIWRYEPPLSEAILALKFRRLDFLAEALAELSCDRAPLAEGEPFDLLVPVPLAPLRRLLRGFNQAERIARVVGRRFGVPVQEILRRSELLPAVQSRLGRVARRAAGRGRYRVHERADLSGRRILLVDDLVTTGATLRAGAQALLHAGANRVAGFALAATPARSWRAPAVP